MRVCSFAIMIFLGWSAAPAWADSDGYYCVGRDYIAYQFGFAQPPVAQHRLSIIAVGGATPLREPATLELPQFQVRGILCNQRTVQLAALNAIYTVELDSALRPVRYAMAPWADRQHTPPQFVGHEQNLGAWSRPVGTLAVERVLLTKNAAGHEFLLEITPTASTTERCVVEITTRVLELSATGQTVRERVVFRGRGYRECGGEQPPAGVRARRGHRS
jgi:hypothetical protein